MTELDNPEPSLAQIVGGADFFVSLVDHFYDGVKDDDVLIPLYTDGSNTTAARRHLAMFLEQYWGGSDAYSTERGHPRLRMRHAPFVIGDKERDRWLVHMLAALEVQCASLPEQVRNDVHSQFVAYVKNTADHLRNS
ncbi:MAG: globin [Ilumatobacteraceae bacterium]|nr:globin [Ilumatobacteraceae bacterium]